MEKSKLTVSTDGLGKVETGAVHSTVKRKSSTGRCGACLRSVVTFLASTVGLTILTAGYCALGGYIFMILESPNSRYSISTESDTVTESHTVTSSKTVTKSQPVTELPMEEEEAVIREAIAVSMDRHLDRLWNVTEELNIIYKEAWKQRAKEVLDSYTAEVYSSIAWNRSTVKKEATVMTTMSPVGEGRATVVVEDQWSYPGALLYAITVVTTIGYGHITPKTMWGMIVTIVYAVFGIPLTVLTLAHLGRIMATAFRFIYRHICCCFACRARDTQRPKRPTDATNTKETTPCVENGNGGDEKPAEVVEPPAKKNLSEVKVPICVTIMVLVVYIAIGSLLFTLWEGWSIVEASYFCFITLSTIGFGDFVPGTSLDAGKSHEKLLCCAVYLLLGLSFLMMCFDLIQEQVVHKFQSLGKCIGLVKDEEKPEEE